MDPDLSMTVCHAVVGGGEQLGTAGGSRSTTHINTAFLSYFGRTSGLDGRVASISPIVAQVASLSRVEVFFSGCDR
jgi:hypothetical protein